MASTSPPTDNLVEGREREHASPHINLFSRVLYMIGPGGMLCILWTIVICVALFKTDLNTLSEARWADLYNMWVNLLWLWLGSVVLAWGASAVDRWRKSRRSRNDTGASPLPIPTVAPPPAQQQKAEQPGKVA